MKTSGDIFLDRSLESIGGKGLFIKELDRALLEGRIDFAVHSLKDLPAMPERGIKIAAYFRREDPRDVLVLPEEGGWGMGDGGWRRREQGAGSREQGTGNREQGTGNREQGTGNGERGTGRCR
jgi:hydroxymethylbilane synthase